MAERSVEILLAKLLDDLGVEYAADFDDIPELLAVFCKHRRLIRILLTLCED